MPGNATFCDCGALHFVVYGEPGTKANSRRLVAHHGKPRFIKSKKALDYAKLFEMQCPQLDDLLDVDLFAFFRILYASRRPDLDESLLLDLMQGRIYRNDRSVRERHTIWGLDRECPRSEILLRPLASRSCSNADGCLLAQVSGSAGSFTLVEK